MASLIPLIGAALALLLTQTSAQLFPFSALRSYIDQQHSESSDHTTNAPPPVDAYRYLQESRNPYVLSGPPREPDLTERTVIVTPKPKYVPQRLVPEPEEDPNSPNIPSIGFGSAQGVSGYKSKESLTLSSASSPIRSVTIERPTESHKKETNFEPIVLKEKPPILLKEKPSKTHYFEKTVVDSIPSLSVTIPLDNYKRKPSEGILDFLVPPKYPSVYENHVLSLDSAPQNLIDEDKPLAHAPIKSKKKKKNKNKFKVDTSISGSEKNENRLRVRRPTIKRKKVSSVGPIELQASATEIYHKPSSFSPSKAAHSTLHPIEEQIAAETSIGLGGKGGGRERVEFQLHGQNGPETYKFGFDTGDGKNRHFRYEEKDHKGNVKGHYGYYDKTGKLQVVNYHADEHGFHASSP